MTSPSKGKKAPKPSNIPQPKQHQSTSSPAKNIEEDQLLNQHIRTGPRKVDPKSRKPGHSPKDVWRSSVFQPSSYKASSKDVVNKKLTLEYVRGYRISKCRHNLYSAFNLGHHFVCYPVAGLVCLLNIDQKKQTYFSRHTDDVVALTFNPATGNFASGEVGRNPAVHVWNISWPSKSIVCLKPGEVRAIASLAFSFDGSLLLVIGEDEDSTVFVYEWEESEKPRFQQTGGKRRILDSTFIGANEFVTVGERNITFWKIEGNQLVSSNGIFGDLNNIRTLTSVACLADGTVATGSLLGDILIWDDGRLIHAIPNAHGTVPTYALQAYTQGFVSAGADGFINFWDNDGSKISSCKVNGQIRTLAYQGSGPVIAGLSDSTIVKLHPDGSSVQTLTSGHNGLHDNELWGLAVNPVVRDQYATCSDDEMVKLWILSKPEPYKQANISGKGRCCDFSPDGKKLVVGTTLGNIHVLDYSTFKVSFTMYDTKENVMDLKFSPDGNFLAAASADNEIRIYSCTANTQYSICKILHGHSSFVCHIDWSLNSKYMQSNSGDNELLFWNVEKGSQEKKPSQLRDTVWATSTCTQTWATLGTWKSGMVGNDINAVDANPAKSLIVTADDFGKVTLYNYPAMEDGPFDEYSGHSSHVTTARFTKDGNHIITVGGMDNAIMQWSVVDSK